MTVEDDAGLAETVAEAALRSTGAVAESVQKAAEANERSDNPDPEVGRLLETAALQAHQSLARVGWIRGWLRRLRGAHH